MKAANEFILGAIADHICAWSAWRDFPMYWHCTICKREAKESLLHTTSHCISDRHTAPATGASGYTDADEVKMMSWFPVYEYSVHGTVLRKRASVGTVRPEVSVGQKVNLYVNPNHPDEFYSPADKSASCEKCLLVWVHYA